MEKLVEEKKVTWSSASCQKPFEIHFDQLVRTVSWELKEIKKKVTKVCSKKSYQVRREAAAHESKIFWKRMFDLKAAPKGQVKLSSFFFLLQSLVTFFFNSYSS